MPVRRFPDNRSSHRQRQSAAPVFPGRPSRRSPPPVWPSRPPAAGALPPPASSARPPAISMTSCTPADGGQRLGYQNDQICQLDQLHQNLGHIVGQRHHFALGNDALLHLAGREPQHCHNAQIDHHIGNRVHQCGNPSGPHLTLIQILCQILILPLFLFLPAECPDNPDNPPGFLPQPP